MHRRKRTLRSLPPGSCLALLAVLGACGNRAEPTTPSPSGEGSTSTSSASAGAESSAAPAGAAPARMRKPFEVYNACTDVVTIVFGDDPKAPTAGKKTIAASASTEGPRDGEGNQTVWLLDTQAEPLVKVRVTKGMKRVEIGRSCRTLDAR